MARVRNELGKLIKDLDRVTASVAFVGPTRAAVQVVNDLQDLGPVWTGRFANSWQIQTPSQVFKPASFMQEGPPRQIPFPTTTGSEALKGLKPFGDRVVFRISNQSPHKKYAMDQAEGRFFRPENNPLPINAVSGKWQEGMGGRGGTMKRGDTSKGRGRASSTAELDWFSTYASGRLNKTIKLEMNKVVK
jgi:hypothetical protein